ncbi:MAG: AraC family transcriptional regulator ligand-binding domain-containing protein [Halioglobus sp.]
MSEITISAKKFLRLFDYIERIGLDVDEIVATVNLVPERIAELPPEQRLPAQPYSRLYKATVLQMQTLGQPLPWAAGIGSEAFELMCHCIISSRTLGDALRLATRFDKLLFPVLSYNIRLIEDDSTGIAKLSYRINLEEEESRLVPKHWDRAGYQQTVAKASGLLVWHAFCGWLTGQPLDADEVRVAAPYLNQAYYESLGGTFHCPIYFDADENTFSFSAQQLQRRIVHTVDSLQGFLNNLVYQLIASEKEPASTSAAIKSLVSIDMPQGMPSFTEIADHLHMSESSLRRRLQKETTSYQALKDEVRCEVAIDKLLNENAKVADLAEYLGFTEPSSFVRSFKGWTGQTPKAYKEKIRSLGRP